MWAHGRWAAVERTSIMAMTTHQDFLAASHSSPGRQGDALATLFVLRTAASWQAANERRVLAQIEPRLLADAGLERFGNGGRD